MSIGANAGTIVGSEDNTTGWWSAFSDYYTLTGDGSVTISFTNYSDKANNWDNWLCVCASDAERQADGYVEYFVMRSDNYGWGPTWNTATNPETGTLLSNYNWDTFKEDLDSATVSLTLTRKGETLKMRANTTTTTGTRYYESWEQTVTDLPETIRFFLTTEKGHLDITSASVNKPNYVAYGNSGRYNSTGYEAYTFPCGEVQNAYTEVYSDSVVVRDFCGFSGYDLAVTTDAEGTISHLYQIIDGVCKESVWGTYSYVYTGASVTATDICAYVPYCYTWAGNDETSGSILLAAYIYNADNTYVWDYYYFAWGSSAADVVSGISTVAAEKQAADAPMFNLAGQRVNKDAKGLVIKNGKKMMLK